MPARLLVCRAAWLPVLLLAGCAGGKNNLFSEANPLSHDARLVRDVSEAPEGIGRERDKLPGEVYRVEPGDVLLVQPVELASPLRLPGDQPVLPDGSIRLGILGTLDVMNRTVEEIQQAIDQRAAEKKINEKITVRLITRDSKVFYVMGEVNAPGAFQLKGRETVLDALLAAGGLNSNASHKNVILVRPTDPDSCRVVLPVNYWGIVQLGDTTTNYQIRAGDRVFVPTKTFCEDLIEFLNKDPNRGTTATPCYPRRCP